ncbi:ketopantoate reductase family protein [Cytobacillus gottheilii]|uniref:ketopantoate reductase family protein n=1 Tax=Cytobacillus gottheilii TaxID=859144 RepID=UPI003CE8596B
MRILVVGAGAIGGYFGGRLAEKGEDVTFLVREKRKEYLYQHGLSIESVNGSMQLAPKMILSGEKADPFDIILLSVKSYHLDQAVVSMRPYVGEHTYILPLLNGIAHLDLLQDAFGKEKVLGGLCFIESTIGESGNIVQMSPLHELVFGPLPSTELAHLPQLKEVLSGTKAEIRYSDSIEQEMWHKYVFISALSGVTSLFRSPIGPIRDDQNGQSVIQSVVGEVTEIAKAINAPVADNLQEIVLTKLQILGFQMKSSLQRDMEKNLPTEADHFFGYLLQQKNSYTSSPVLSAIYSNITIYEKSL